MSWWFSGNVYFYKSRDITGAVKKLWYLPHFLVTPRWPGDRRNPQVPLEKDTDPFLSHYEYRVPGREPVLYPAADILHLRRYVDLSNPRLGLGAFECLYEELYGDKKMALFTAAIMANMGIQVPVFSPKEKGVTVSPEHAAAMKEGWIGKTTGENAGEPVIWTEPMDMEMFGLSPTDLDLSNLRMIPESRVAAVTGIPAPTLQFMVGLQNGTSYASSEQARQQGYEEVIEPIQKVWAEHFTWQLLPDFKGSESSQFVFDTTDVRVLQEDKDALYRRESEALRAGGITLNQFLQNIGSKPIGPQGDIYYIPGMCKPMTVERLTATADGSLASEPIDPNAQQVADAADIQKVLANLEREMEHYYANPR
jgi:phage portal protein BeeE